MAYIYFPFLLFIGLSLNIYFSKRAKRVFPTQQEIH